MATVWPIGHFTETLPAGGGVSLGSARCGAWQLATSMLADAGFGDVQVREVESDPLKYYYSARR